MIKNERKRRKDKEREIARVIESEVGRSGNIDLYFGSDLFGVRKIMLYLLCANAALAYKTSAAWRSQSYPVTNHIRIYCKPFPNGGTIMLLFCRRIACRFWPKPAVEVPTWTPYASSRHQAMPQGMLWSCASRWWSWNHTFGTRGCSNGLGQAITSNVWRSSAANGGMQTESNAFCVNTPALRTISSGLQIRSSPVGDTWNNFLSACTADSACALRSYTDRSLLQHGPVMKILSAGIVVRSLDATDAMRLIVASAIATSIQTAAKSDLSCLEHNTKTKAANNEESASHVSCSSYAVLVAPSTCGIAND